MPIRHWRSFVAFSEHLMLDLARTLVILAFLGIWGWTVRSVIRVWLPFVRKSR
jgi:hypothetical protein